ncbi:MAG: hypothetical protein KIT11_08505 [Fimbriimonadaceae bacterium]|nr:hypothetical protein [Fimbriimonadaceae bacterium]QYK56394.1 MAG: hypothetical protein KF733_02700 [Fimbriimonadaceae bacterium]
MSISKIRSAFEKKGCQVILAIVGIALAGALIVPSSCQGFLGQGNGPGHPADSPTVAEVSGEKVTAAEVSATYAVLQQRGSTNPTADFYTMAGALDFSVNRAIDRILAKRVNVQLDATTQDAAFEEVWNRQLEQQKFALIQAGKLKFEDTDEKFKEVIKKESGRDISELKKTWLDAQKKELDDPERGPLIKGDLLGIVVGQAYERTATATEAELKKSFDQFELTRIVFSGPGVKQEDALAQADKALDELKKGANFGEVKKKYNKATTAPATLTYPRTYVESVDELKPITELKPGQYTEVIEESQTVSIYALVQVKANLPADFEKNKIQLLDSFKRRHAIEKRTADVEALEKDIVWKSDGYRLVYDLYKGFRTPQGPSDEKLKEFVKQTEGLTSEDPFGQKLVTLARYVALSSYYPKLSPKEQEEARPDKIATLTSLLEDTESPQIRLELSELYITEEDYDSAAEQLVLAAQVNTSTDPEGQALHESLKKQLAAARGIEKYPKDMLDKVQAEITRWEKDKAEEQNAAKEAAAEQKKLDEELKKLEEGDDKTPQEPTPKPGG